MAKKTSRKRTARAIIGTKQPAKAAKTGDSSRRADLGADVSLYFDSLSGWQATLARRLDKLVRKAAPKATSVVKWGMPVYEHRGMLCYICARAKYVTLGFYGQDLGPCDPHGLLEGTGKDMRHIKIAPDAAIDDAYLMALVRSAAAENEAA